MGTGLGAVLGVALEELLAVEVVVKSTATMGLGFFVVFCGKVTFSLAFFVDAKVNMIPPAKENVHLPPDRRYKAQHKEKSALPNMVEEEYFAMSLQEKERKWREKWREESISKMIKLGNRREKLKDFTSVD